jgi:hypothetical protein
MKPLVSAAVLLAAALALPGCVSMSRSSAMVDMPADWRTGGRVTEIRLDHEGVRVSPEFGGVFQARVQKKLDACANGQRPLRLDVKIEKVRKSNPGMVLLIGGSNKVRSKARLVDPATGAAVGEYAIGKTIMGSRIAIFQMAQAEEQLSDAFGDEICKQAFKAPVVK